MPDKKQLIPALGADDEELGVLDTSADRVLLTNTDVKLSDCSEEAISVIQLLDKDRALDARNLGGFELGLILQLSVFSLLDDRDDFRFYSTVETIIDRKLNNAMSEIILEGSIPLLQNQRRSMLLLSAADFIPAKLFCPLYLLLRMSVCPSVLIVRFIFINGVAFLKVPARYVKGDYDIRELHPYVDRELFEKHKSTLAERFG